MTPLQKLLGMGFRHSNTTVIHNTMYIIYEKEGSSITLIYQPSGKSFKTKQPVSIELAEILISLLKDEAQQ